MERIGLGEQIPLVLAECKRVPRPGGRIGVVGILKEEGHGVVFHLHKHFPKFVDCRPFFIARALEEAGFRVQKYDHLRI